MKRFRLFCLGLAVVATGFPAAAEPLPNADLPQSTPLPRWLAAREKAETVWEEIIQSSNRFSLQPRMENTDARHAEGLLEAFGTRYMPNAYAHYQEVRAQALELEQTLKENFPRGFASDPTGGTIFAKAEKSLAVAVARALRRRDELCFFLLFHQAGVFSESELADYDSRPIAILLAAESKDWPDDTPTADTALPAEDDTFAAKYLPETHAGYLRLCGLFDGGSKQYAELRRTALALDAPRARLELGSLKTRLLELQPVLRQFKKELSLRRFEHAVGETTAARLASLDCATAVRIQAYEQSMELKTYVLRAATTRTVRLPGGALMEMVWCPPGSFEMGDPDDASGEAAMRKHRVTLTKGFWMAKTEVTQAQWKSVMRFNPSKHVGENLPVENASWLDCQAFCKRTGLQLPSEAQWEYACRAGTTEACAGLGNLETMGWYSGNSGGESHPVGQKLPNAWGLHDMHGNVWEWCADWYGDYPDGAVTNPAGASTGRYRVLRGGCYGIEARCCHSKTRGGDSPYRKFRFFGFRPVVRQE